MSKTNDFETSFLDYFLNNEPVRAIGGGVAGFEGSSTTGSFGLALFTADPGEAGSVANEATYTGYTRAAVPRDGTYWNVVDGVATLASAVTFAACTGGSNTITHYALCYSTTPSTSDIVWYDDLTASLAVSDGVTPQFAASGITITED